MDHLTTCPAETESRACSDACRAARYRRRRDARRADAADALASGLRGDPHAFARGLAEAVDLLRPAA